MASVLKKYQKLGGHDANNTPTVSATATPTPLSSEKKPAEKKLADKKPAKAVKKAEIVVAAVEIAQEPESIAQTNSGSDELMTNSADKQEVDNDTNESSNLEKQIEAQAKEIEEKAMQEQK